jgi:hypothetical protein
MPIKAPNSNAAARPSDGTEANAVQGLFTPIRKLSVGPT